MTKIVVLDGYELNHDLNWASLSTLGHCTFALLYAITDSKEVNDQYFSYQSGGHPWRKTN
ncbi:hypothetical protein [Fructobacillus evanidus]|uniref:Lactate dehydrogenase or related 2-hydroxyacid dehydrogenase (LdhA) n=1 Tax=Fructobacillus evanidus TaxID=3064281 RepID=A0ABN9YTY3_9LACO|nr:Lactate dehydrogenase or related 2-hydroxyacid dehydrogenase (LdhA) [Fructobacillus sp. LMG 32999]CAK1229059.1 Lactate dehydrogenase or related 2-hydroxyacid dehydrogenase (LdhA) [Fructobacillus sp. LMG 32999]CAK1231560.1 Lactate dehydrogenase or related 2-hydroxyacid dehydrogenase (LdhA) [Fructobacillus sp. LMG 32999]CAK1231668.1 Lactate dehydrogenase or related 2-hydroxyacid dehydrogenase (LdhA) [Fructobacillus sp. LMG 32999]CAK1232773.1 Lactate dehydrogenase or related 2-hydroxyacid dehyd